MCYYLCTLTVCRLGLGNTKIYNVITVRVTYAINDYCIIIALYHRLHCTHVLELKLPHLCIKPLTSYYCQSTGNNVT